MRKVFLDHLPMYGGNINWTESIGRKVKFIYDDIEGEIELVSYEIKKQLLYVQYLNKDIYKIKTNEFRNCQLGKLLNKITSEFRMEIGQNFKDEKRDITIIKREHREKIKNSGKNQNYKWYRYKCNRCGYNEGWIEETKINRGDGCSCCGSHKKVIILGINTIWDTDRWMCDLGVSEEDTKTHTRGSNKKITIICTNCNKVREGVVICKVYERHSISCSCGDGFSYPEKLMNSVLEQLNIDFETHKFFDWSKNVDLCNAKEYDFYIPSLNCIIETHGEQHYRQQGRKGAKTLKEEQENDDFKESLAKTNGVNSYIIINCEKGEIEHIKNNILNSKLSNIYDLNKINWNICEEFALSNLCKSVCEFKNSNLDMTSADICLIMKLSRVTIIRYLKKGNNLGWVKYCINDEKVLGSLKTCKKLEMYKNNMLIGIFNGCSELSKQSNQLFNVDLLSKGISSVCRGDRKTYKGYTFKYV